MDDSICCEVICDLLPSYVDGLTSDVTNELVERHLAQCERCRAVWERMKVPEQHSSTQKEIDYLKKTRKTSKRTAILCALAAVVFAAMLFFVPLYWIGTEADGSAVIHQISVTGNTVSLEGSLLDGGVAGLSYREEDGVLTVQVKASPITWFHQRWFESQYTADQEIVQVQMGGLVLWDHGKTISRTTAQVFAAKNPYVGNMPANQEVALALGIQDQFGSYQNVLQTAGEPYDWKLILNEPLQPEWEEGAREMMASNAYVMLAVVGNLGSVTWQYTTAGQERIYTVTAEDASAYIGCDIKTCADTPAALQNLMQKAWLAKAAVRSPGIQTENVFYLHLAQKSGEEIGSISVGYYLNGKLVGSTGIMNADETPISKGETMTFEFASQDLGESATSFDLSSFQFDIAVTDREGKELWRSEPIALSAAYGWNYYYTLTGNQADGFSVTEG